MLRGGGEWEVLANDLGEGCYATPALSGGVRTDQALYAFTSAASNWVGYLRHWKRVQQLAEPPRRSRARTYPIVKLGPEPSLEH